MPPRRPREPLPPALPPAERTVGQLVAETIRFYGSHFWPSVALGIGPAAAGLGLSLFPGWWRTAFVLTAGALLLTGSYVAATVLVHEVRPPARVLVTATAAGYLVFLPVPFLRIYLLPAVAWLALFGLIVPAVVVERAGIRDGFKRAFALARADYVHALGSLATLVIAAFLTSTVLYFLLREQGQAARWAAAFLSLLVISPLLFLGAAFLYFDQAARELGSRPKSKRRKSRNAHLPADDDADRPGRANPQGQS